MATEKYYATVYDCETGETTTRELTPEEIEALPKAVRPIDEE